MGRIASELNAITMIWYKHLHLASLLNADTDASSDSHKNAFNAQLIEFFDKFTNYFVQEKILNKTADAIPESVRLLLQIGLELCNAKEEGRPELQQLIMISAILSLRPVDRLESCTAKLEDTEIHQLHLLKDLLATDYSESRARAVLQTYDGALPFSGMYKKIATIAETNTPEADQELKGKALLELHWIKKRLEARNPVLQTDLINLISKYPRTSDAISERFENQSRRIHPRKDDILDLDTPDDENTAAQNIFSPTILSLRTMFRVAP